MELTGGARVQRTVAAAAAAAAMSLAAGGAMAQSAADEQHGQFERNGNIGVRDRPRPEYDALGVRRGVFLIYPKLTLSPRYDDNVFASETHGEGDLEYTIEPEVTISSDWSRHSVSATLSALVDRYANHGSENTLDLNAQVSGRLDILRDSSLDGWLQYQRLNEPRGAPSAILSAKSPIRYDLGRAYLGGRKEFNRLRISGRVDWRRYDYHDGVTAAGVTVEEDFRDRNETTLTARGDYALTPATALFVEVVPNWRVYDSKQPLPVGSRDSKGVTVLTGANFELSHLMTGEVGVGYLHQTYDNPAFDSVGGLALRGRVRWFPTQLVTVSLGGQRTVEESGLRQAGGDVLSAFDLQADWEVLRNVIITGKAGYGFDKYRTIDRRDNRYTVGLSAAYLVNRSVGVTLGYTRFEQDSNGADRGVRFTDDRAGLSLTLQR